MPVGTELRKTDRVLVISPFAEDHRAVRKILSHSDLQQHDARTRGEACEFLEHNSTSVAICECELPDGSWKDLLWHLNRMERPPVLVVTSRLADENLWSEVLHFGGHDVLSKPLDSEEVMHVIEHACLSWSNGTA